MCIDIPFDKVCVFKYPLMKTGGSFNALYSEFRQGSLHSLDCHRSVFAPHDKFSNKGIIKRRNLIVAKNMGIQSDPGTAGDDKIFYFSG